MHISLSINAALVLLLCIASAFDIAQRRIPNRLVATGLVMAFGLHAISGESLSLLTLWLGGCATGLVLFLPLHLLRAMAAGDVKLMMMVGAFCGPDMTVEISLATYIAGGVMALCIVVARGKARQAISNIITLLRPFVWRLIGVQLAVERGTQTSVGSMPYGVAITAGALVVLWLRQA